MDWENCPNTFEFTFTFLKAITANPRDFACAFTVFFNQVISRGVVNAIPTENFFCSGIFIPNSVCRISRKNGLGISVSIPVPSPVSLSADIAPLCANRCNPLIAKGRTLLSGFPESVTINPIPQASWNESLLKKGYMFLFFLTRNSTYLDFGGK